MKAHKVFNWMVFLFSVMLLPCCDQLSDICDEEEMEVEVSTDFDYTFVWLTTVQDVYVDNLMPEFTGNTFSLDVNHGLPNGERRSYIQFFIPHFPEGTEVLEAYINVYEDSQQNPGSHSIGLLEATAPWNYSTINWQNQPTPPGQGNFGTASIKAFEGLNKWRGSNNIKVKAQQIIDDPSSHYGFILSNESQFNFTRGFTSMNAPNGRTEYSLGNCPRFLLKLKSDAPLTADNISTTINGPSEFFDLYGSGNEFLIYSIATGDNWPPEWNVDTQ